MEPEIYTITNREGECITIDKAALLDNCLALGVFDSDDRREMFSVVFRGHLKRAHGLIDALDTLARDRNNEVYHERYREARRALEVDTIYYHKILQD